MLFPGGLALKANVYERTTLFKLPVSSRCGFVFMSSIAPARSRLVVITVVAIKDRYIFGFHLGGRMIAALGFKV